MITLGCRVTLLVALPAQRERSEPIRAGATGRVVRVCNGWLDVVFGECYRVRGIDPAMVREAT